MAGASARRSQTMPHFTVICLWESRAGSSTKSGDTPVADLLDHVGRACPRHREWRGHARWLVDGGAEGASDSLEDRAAHRRTVVAAAARVRVVETYVDVHVVHTVPGASGSKVCVIGLGVGPGRDVGAAPATADQPRSATPVMAKPRPALTILFLMRWKVEFMGFFFSSGFVGFAICSSQVIGRSHKACESLLRNQVGGLPPTI